MIKQPRFRVVDGASQTGVGFRTVLAALILLLVVQLAPAAEQTLTRLRDEPFAPAFKLSGIDGRHWRLGDFRGKPVIVNFWATWCPPCRAEMPSMQRAWEMVGDEGIAVLGINLGEDVETVLRFIEQVPVRFPVLMDADGSVTKAWPLKGLPTTFVVDPEGRIVYKATGERDWDDPGLLQLVRELKVQPTGNGNGLTRHLDDAE